MSMLWAAYGLYSLQGSADAKRGASAANRAELNVKYLEQRLDRLTLLCASMWELLSERAGVGEEDLIPKIYEVDMRDGQADGKIAGQIKKCPSCQRTMSPRHQRCLYCGGENIEFSPFDGV